MRAQEPVFETSSACTTRCSSKVTAVFIFSVILAIIFGLALKMKTAAAAAAAATTVLLVNGISRRWR
jgi:uncharacterized membrane protein